MKPEPSEKDEFDRLQRELATLDVKAMNLSVQADVSLAISDQVLIALLETIRVNKTPSNPQPETIVWSNVQERGLSTELRFLASLMLPYVRGSHIGIVVDPPADFHPTKFKPTSTAMLCVSALPWTSIHSAGASTHSHGISQHQT